MRSLPKTSTHDQQWKLNTRLSDLEFNTLLFNTLFTETYDPMQKLWVFFVTRHEECFTLKVSLNSQTAIRHSFFYEDTKASQNVNCNMQ